MGHKIAKTVVSGENYQVAKRDSKTETLTTGGDFVGRIAIRERGTVERASTVVTVRHLTICGVSVFTQENTIYTVVGCELKTGGLLAGSFIFI